ncbi:hypothetical protein MKW92_026733 [Papaver armeniacum]|nr:hypothetical protein MKW92_026733 [Papaver armeniacum]
MSYHYFMWLNKYAKIQQLEVDASTFPPEIFTFLPMEMVPGRKNDNHFYTNVIGRLHSISNTVVKQVEEQGETKMGETMKINLWAELATKIDDGILDSNETAAVIIIVTGTFVKERMGLISLSTTQASRVFVNLDCQQMHIEQEKDPFEDKISLYEASQMLIDYENKDKMFFCEASIVRFIEGKGWYYIACKNCKKQVKDNNGKISCPGCKNNFDGEDQAITPNIDLTILDLMSKMLKYTHAEHVLENREKATQVFDKLIGENFGFKLKITEENIQKQTDNYTVLKVHTMIKRKNTSSEQLGPKTPQKEKQLKVMLLEDEIHQAEKQRSRKKLRRKLNSEENEDDADAQKDGEMEDDIGEKEDDEDENNENTKVKKRNTPSEQNKKRLRRMLLEDDEETQEDIDEEEDDKDEKEDDEDEGDEDE